MYADRPRIQKKQNVWCVWGLCLTKVADSSVYFISEYSGPDITTYVYRMPLRGLEGQQEMLENNNERRKLCQP